LWKDFIDWERRRKGEDNFLKDQLEKHNVKTIFDASLGDGCDSIYLLKQGFTVTSNDIDEVFIRKAFQNAKNENVHLKVTKLDWRNLDNELAEESFDAVILLGNSLTHLLSKKDQAQALDQFNKLLKMAGVLIIDERNYQYMLDSRDEILQGNFQYSGKYVYCGARVKGTPVEITDSQVKMVYKDVQNGMNGELIMYPFKRGEMKSLLTNAGFTSIEQFSDYKSEENTRADFYQYVCVK
jgi:SAM-dependent methyltransferase